MRHLSFSLLLVTIVCLPQEAMTQGPALKKATPKSQETPLQPPLNLNYIEDAPASVLVALSTDFCQTELKLTPQQRVQIAELRRECEQHYQQIVKDYDQDSEANQKSHDLDKRLEGDNRKTASPRLKTILTQEQVHRLGQLYTQLKAGNLRTSLFQDRDCAEYLQLTDSQKQNVDALLKQHIQQNEKDMDTFNNLLEKQPVTAYEEQAKKFFATQAILELDCLRKIKSLLTSSQKQRLDKLIGEKEIDRAKLLSQIQQHEIRVSAKGGVLVIQ
ncbi:MAG: hypothetical protein U0903_01435 [Planctomycetales bacterium]